MKSIKEISRDIAFYSKGHMRELDRLLRVWGFAREIADGEALSRRERYALEVAALTHNIAYPLCRETYGSEDPALQAREGAALVRDFLRDADMPAEQLERIVYLVSRHQNFEPSQEADLQILLEAVYIATVREKHRSRAEVKEAMKTLFRTKSGIAEAGLILNL